MKLAQFKLSELQSEILRVMCTETEKDDTLIELWYSFDIADCLPPKLVLRLENEKLRERMVRIYREMGFDPAQVETDFEPYTIETIEEVIEQFSVWYLPRTMTALEKKGFIVSVKDRGMKRYKLGPMSDLYKEEKGLV